MSRYWSLDDIEWERFDPSKVDAELLGVVKTASLVEANSPDYVSYLRGVFDGDRDFCEAVDVWGAEERQHGEALGRWATLADPDFDFEASLRRVQQDGYKLPLDAQESVRGSQTGELIARCVVESGTTSFYSAMHDGTDEPVLKQITSYIAQDETRHFTLFRRNLRKYEAQSGRLPLRRRLGVVLGRMAEKDDDEFAYAYYAANLAHRAGVPYDREHCAQIYERGALGLYGFSHLATGATMTLKAIGFDADSLLTRLAVRATWFAVRRRLRALDRLIAA